MIKDIQNQFFENAEKSSRVLGKVSECCANLHKRAIPQYAQNSYNLGIAAVQHRRERNELQKAENVDREQAEKRMQQKKLADLCIWEDVVQKTQKSVPQTSSRAYRATTRQLTTQIRLANQESKGAQQKLKQILEVPLKKRDATPEVHMHTRTPGTHTLIHILIHTHAY